jgi:hypothetical protein
MTDGTVFVITGKFEVKTEFFFDDGFDCYLTTDCSVPLVAGDQIGPFTVLEGNGCSTLPPILVPPPAPTIAL